MSNKILGQVFFGLHMAPGVAEYRPAGQEPYRVMLTEDTIKAMDASYSGKPVYVRHATEIDLEKADGYVIESFYNPADGKHWAQFLVTTQNGLEAIRNHWKLSNCYFIKETRGGGLWHGLDYDKEVARGEYEHLAIVNDPRYEESVILTPEEFKAYNAKKVLEAKRLANSKEKKTVSLFSLFKKEKVENSAELENLSVILPKSKIEKTVTQLVNEADVMAMEVGKPRMANGDDEMMLGEEKLSINAMIEKYNAVCNELAEMKKNAGGAPAPEVKKPENAEDEEKKKKEKEEGEKHANSLKNAPFKAVEVVPTVELGSDKAQRGVSRYGSGK